MRIDSHQHFWRYDMVRHGWISKEMSALRRDFMPKDLVPELRQNGMDGSIAVQTEQSEEETNFLLELASQHSEVKGVVGWVDLRARNLPDRLNYFSQFSTLCGFRHIAQSERHDRFLVQEDFLRGIGHLRDFDFSYDILIYPRQLTAAIELVGKFPDQKFVLDHLAKPAIRSREMLPWADQIRIIAQNPNVYCKLSGMVTEADWSNWRSEDLEPYLDVIFEAFGTDRLMFGSDWPVCLVAASYKRVRDLIGNYVRDLPVTEQNKIFGLNAVSFYGLGSNHEPEITR